MNILKSSLAMIVVVPLLSGLVLAQGFFDKGKDMLKGLGVQTPSADAVSALSIG
jgi:hypothetical protein